MKVIFYTLKKVQMKDCIHKRIFLRDYVVLLYLTFYYKSTTVFLNGILKQKDEGK